MAETEAAASKTYTGSCHCGTNRYTVTLSPPLEDGHKLINCNCSICLKNGYLLAFVDFEPEKFKWDNGGFDHMKGYLFGKKALTHYFCPECGTSLAGGMGSKIGINARTINNIDIGKLTLMPYDGKSR